MLKPARRFLGLCFLILLGGLDLHAEVLPFSEVRKGMKGYGLTVFEGSKVEKFDVEILGVLNNIGPKQNLILARVDSPVIRNSGVIAGMSGSPIYIDGKIIGALAYSWMFAKDPIAGITPIEEMLRLEQIGPGSHGAVPAKLPATELLTALVERKTQPLFEKLIGSMSPARTALVGGALPISTPLSFSSFAPETLARFGSMLEASGFIPVPSGTTSGSSSAITPARPFEPGDAIGAVLLDGDFSLAATGTVTHVDGKRVYGFGHPFLDMGEIDFPMAQSEVVTVMSSVARSFKFSNAGPIVGSLKQDRYAGIMGYLGQEAEMIPVEVILNGSRGSQTYKFRSIRHPQLFPLIVAMAADSIVAGAQRSAGERTVLLDSEIHVRGFEPIRLRDGWAGLEARQAIPAYLAVVSSYLLSNEFNDAAIDRVKITLHHDDHLKIAKILEASIDSPDDGEVNPGDTLRVRTVLKPFRGEPFVENFEVKVPEHQKPGNAYLFVGSGTAVNQLDFYLVPPDPRTLAHVIDVIERLRPATDLTVGLYSSSDGAVMAGVYLPNLPPSIQAIVTGDSTNAAQAPVRYHAPQHESRPLGYIVDGAVKIDLQVRSKL